VSVRTLAITSAAAALVITSAGFAAASASSSAPAPTGLAAAAAAQSPLHLLGAAPSTPGVDLIGKQTVRLSGKDRYATSVAVSSATWDPSFTGVVFLASGENYADALSAGASTFLSGPLLLTAHDSLPPVVAAEISRLQPCEVVVVGGTAAVSDAVAQQADALADVASSKCTDPGA
jgi:putative cell wall-binding protein